MVKLTVVNEKKSKWALTTEKNVKIISYNYA